ncbi:MAG: tRNA pseudouridine(38-40) synthase TruA [Muribaculaceae bacterium]|nr:tRNA pseudouridine(38-40) synthase TruA [Muribaculaceae bacterium]
MRLFIKLAYEGAPFHGWQIQPNAVSVQQTIEEALSTILRVPVSIIGAGRTDTGVNARVMYAHFDWPEEAASHWKDPLSAYSMTDGKRRFLLSINRLCGPAIAIQDIFPVADDAHARFDASKRTYKYFVTFEKSPFLAPLSWHSPSLLDIEKMNQAASLLLTTDDFTSFAKLHSDAKTNICKVTRAEWKPWNSSFLPACKRAENPRGIVFTISADRFLRNMVRAVVGTLVDVGRGKLSIDGFRKIIEAKDRCSAGTSMPPQALFLWDIEYPFIKDKSATTTLTDYIE